MLELTTLIGKPILSVDSSCILGKVTDVYFDEYCKTAVYFCIYPTNVPVCGDPINTEGERRMLLPFGEVQSFSDALVVADGAGLVSPLDVDVTAFKGNMLTMTVYTLSGLHKGNMRNVHISSTGKVQRLCAAENSFTPSAILKIADVILLKNNSKFTPQTGTFAVTQSKRRNSTPKPRKMPRPGKDYPVNILGDFVPAQPAQDLTKSAPVPKTSAQTVATNIENIVPQPANIKIANPASLKPIDVKATYAQAADINTTGATVQILQAMPKPAIAIGADSREPVLSDNALKTILEGEDGLQYDDGHTPTRIICNYEFLVGRTLSADLRYYSGEIIAAAGSIVTESTVEMARRAGKLVELTLYSVKPSNRPQNN